MQAAEDERSLAKWTRSMWKETKKSENVQDTERTLGHLRMQQTFGTSSNICYSHCSGR